jgi:tryptophanyl-tRNA synthetase
VNQKVSEKVSGSRKTVFSGIQPTGSAHLGNLLGAVVNWVHLQEEHKCYFCIVDLHSMTMDWDPQTLRHETVAKGAELLASGIDPSKSVLFVQSHVSAHSELAWILMCVARMGELRRMVQFKEKSKGETESVGVGLFTYPVLQAADVLLYQADGVPVGEDQRQHVELMRDLAQRFNSNFGVTFTLPEAWIPPAGARIMALDDPTQKMSKSEADTRPGSVLRLVDSPEAITRKVRSAVTDSGRDILAREEKPAIKNLLTIYSAVSGTPIPELEKRFAGSGYGDFKSSLAEAVVARLEPIRLRYEELMADPGETERILAAGAAKATEAARPTMDRVRERVGLAP